MIENGIYYKSKPLISVNSTSCYRNLFKVSTKMLKLEVAKVIKATFNKNVRHF